MISVIIPFYNNLEWLIEALQSVFNQTYKNYEIILINDGSEEDLSEVIETYKDRIVYIKIDNSGPGIARNTGIEVAQGKYLAFLDSDDIWIENKLEEQINYMFENDIRWSHTSYETFSNQTKKTISKISLNKVSGFLFNPFLLSCRVATPCVMVEREFLKDNKLRFSTKMRYGEDIFLWINIASIEKIGVVDKILTRVRIRRGNASKKAYNQIYVKAKINEYIHSKEGTHLKVKIPKYVRIIFIMSSLGVRIINKLRYKNELLSKIIYAPIYIYTKLLNNIILCKKKS